MKCGTCDGTGSPDHAGFAMDRCGRCGGSGVLPLLMDLGGRVRLLIIGHGEHGKDAVGAVLREQYGLRVISSSEFAAQTAIFPLVSDIYPDWRAAYADRRHHRSLWYHAIRAYNLRPGPMLAEQVLEDHDAYTGMRSRDEFERSRGLFDLVVWVDASRRLPPEPAGSMELTADDADWIVDNNGAEGALPGEVAKLAAEIERRLILVDAFSRHG